MTGYNITCDPGSLYSRKCYVNTATGKQEIIGYDASAIPSARHPPPPLERRGNHR